MVVLALVLEGPTCTMYMYIHVLVDGHTLLADLLVRGLHVVDEGQRHLVDVRALVGQVAAVLAAGGVRGRVAHEPRGRPAGVPRW